MIGDIKPEHFEQILKINAEFVHWLSPLDEAGLIFILERAHYARQIEEGQAVLLGYAHDVDYPDHKNIRWLSRKFDRFFYIDRVIVDGAAQGNGYGLALYQDFEKEARKRGLPRLVCEVNTKPDNPGSHRFHERFGFNPVGEQYFPDYDKAVRYYEKPL